MRSLAPLLLLTAGLLAGSPCVASSLAPVRHQGRDYHRLADWAQRESLRVARAPNSRDVLAAGGRTRLQLQIDTSRIDFNGVGVWLSYPVVLVDGQVLISSQDVRGVLDPLIRPPRLPASRRIRTICIDAGHGGKQPGQKAGSRLEKTYTLALAQEVRSRLVAAGFRVVMTRESDTYVDVAERAEIARRKGADLFVSLHYNATADGGSDASGIEVYAMTPEGARSTNDSTDVGSLRAWAGNEFDRENLVLAYQLQKSLLASLPGAPDRGVRRARFIVLRLAEMPAALVEGGFMSNPSDARWIYSITGRRKMAQAVVDGVLAFRRLTEPAPSQPQGSTTSRSSRSSTPPASAKN